MTLFFRVKSILTAATVKPLVQCIDQNIKTCRRLLVLCDLLGLAYIVGISYGGVYQIKGYGYSLMLTMIAAILHKYHSLKSGQLPLSLNTMAVSINMA